MDISPLLTGLPQTHKPVTAASVNHYPATLYLVHICRFTGLWNVFSVELGPNQIEMWSGFLRAQSNNIITSDKWQSAGADTKNEKLRSNSATWLIQGISSGVQESSQGARGSDFTHYSDQPMQRGGSGGVVAAVMIGWRLLIFPLLVAFGVERCPLWIQSPNRLQKNKQKKQISRLPLGLLNFTEGNLLVFVQINA